MASVCVDENFRVVGGLLDIAAWAGRRLVREATHSPTNDGNFTAYAPLPGVVHHDVTSTWTNPDPVPVEARVELLRRSGRQVRSSNPNLVMIRDRATLGIGSAPEPDISDVFDSECGGGMDRHGAEDATPSSGVMDRREAASTQHVGTIIVAPGETLHMRYRCVHYTPDPWADNANNNSPTYTANVYAVTLRAWAVAVPEEG